MKRLLLIILVLISVQSFGQHKIKYAERLNTNLTIDSFYQKQFTDSLFAYSNDGFISFTLEYYVRNSLTIPAAFSNFTKSGDGIYRNFTPRSENVDWTGVGNKPSTFTPSAHSTDPADITGSTSTGRALLALATPASISLVRINTDGTVGTRTIAQAQTDLGIDLKADINSPAFTGTPTGIGIPVYARVTGSNATTTGQALVDIAGLSIPLATNAIYEISGMLSVSTTGTAGVQYGLNYSVAGGTVEAQLSGSLTSTATKTERISALNTASTAYLTTSGQTGGIIIRGIITTGANAGNLTVKFLKVTSGTATVFQNSVLKVTRIQ